MAGKAVPDAIRRVLPLLSEPPADPQVGDGYLDLLGGEGDEPAGPVQSLWESGRGSAAYDHAQALVRRLLPAVNQLPEPARRPPSGATVLDVGCGPGNVTAGLGRAVGAAGLAVGLDVSRPMLTRAVRAEAADNVAFVRADARELPFRDGTFDMITSIAALQLIPDPTAVLGALVRALAPGGFLAAMVPTPRGGMMDHATALLGVRGGLSFFDPDETARTLHSHGMSTVHTRRSGTVLWITGRKS